MATRKKADVSKAAVKIEETAAEKIWEKIKNVPIDIFALPNQVVQMHATRIEKLEKAIPDAVHLVLKSAAVLTALEEALSKIPLGKDSSGKALIFDISKMDKYTVIKIVPRNS
jgi:formate dehydrogenase maturation protein FdhE